MALRAPPHRHVMAARRVRTPPRRTSIVLSAFRVPSVVSHGDDDDRVVSSKASSTTGRAFLKTALAVAACAAPHVVPLAASTVPYGGASASRHFAAIAADAAETLSISDDAISQQIPKKPESGVDYPRVSSREISLREMDFRNWLVGVRAECLKRGVSESTIRSCFDAIQPYPEPEPSPVSAREELTAEEAEKKRRAKEKSELSKPAVRDDKVQKYVSSVVSKDRVERGALLLVEHGFVLGEVEREYGVPREILVAIWGIESSFGGFSGNTDCVEALANIAWSRENAGDARDSRYFRNELVEATRIVEIRKKASSKANAGPSSAFETLLGSWDGGLGQCQFMPSNYHAYAVDKDGDGVADIWNSLPDVFASMGNFISKYCEWDPKVRAAGFMARVEDPEMFRRTIETNDEVVGGFWAERGKEKPATFFAWNGLRATHRELQPPPSCDVRLLMPDGTDGLAFLATRNFRSLMRYNPSTQYAMAVSTLAQEIVDEAAEVTRRRAAEASLTEKESTATLAEKSGKVSGTRDSVPKTASAPFDP